MSGVPPLGVAALAAIEAIMLLIAAPVETLVACSAEYAAGAPGVPAAATVAASAAFTVAAAVACADCKAAPAAAGNPRQAGNPPIKTFGLPEPGLSGVPCEVTS